jgi:hypothetical protein
MPLREDIKPPEDDKPKAPKPKADKPDTDKTDPWKYLEDGTKVRQGRKLPLENQLRELFDAVAGGVSMADAFSGQVIGNQSEELAYGYAKLAKEDARVRAFLEKALTGSAYSAVVVPTVMTVIPIAWHFGLVPAKIGVPVTFMSGVPLITRTEEREGVEAAQKAQAEAAQAEARATHPQGQAPGDGDSAA